MAAPTLYDGGLTIPQVHNSHEDIEGGARFCESLGRGFESSSGGVPLFRVWPQALTMRSISTQAPSGSAAAAIVVRAGKG
jgi:hypothetical protein